MYQLPMLAPGVQGPTRPAGTGRADDSTRPADLLTGGDGSPAGLSGDLQALLMPLSPQMLQRLDELLAGGMDLPQAARSLLGELGGDPTRGLFADFLQQRLLPGQATDVAAGANGWAGQLAAGLAAAGAGPRDLADAAAALPALGALHAAAQGANGGPLPTHLTSSLLDMGVPQQVGLKGWDAAIADRLMWMVQGDQQLARLKLNPPNLGPLEVRLSLNQDQASVSFIAQHAAVREALEAALPRLREMFDEQSLQLVRADIADPGAQQGGRADDSATRSPQRSGHWGDDGEAQEDAGTPSAVTLGKGLIDLFA